MCIFLDIYVKCRCLTIFSQTGRHCFFFQYILIINLANWPPRSDAPATYLFAMLTISSSCWFHKSFSTCDTLVLLDPVVPLQVGHQRCPLNELLFALCAMEILLSTVDLFMVGSHVGDSEPFATTLFPAGKALFSSVFCHVPPQVIFIWALLSTFCAHVYIVAVMLVVPVILQGLYCVEVVSALVTVVVLDSSV